MPFIRLITPLHFILNLLFGLIWVVAGIQQADSQVRYNTAPPISCIRNIQGDANQILLRENDSLRKIPLSKGNLSLKCNVYAHLITNFAYLEQYDSLTTYYQFIEPHLFDKRLLSIATSCDVVTVYSKMLFNKGDNLRPVQLLAHAAHKATANRNDQIVLCEIYRTLGLAQSSANLDKQSLESFKTAYQIAQTLQIPILEGRSIGSFGYYYNAGKDFKKSIYYLKIALKKFQEIQYTKGIAGTCLNLNGAYYHINNLDSAIYYAQIAYTLFKKINDVRSTYSCLNNIANNQKLQGKYAESLNNYMSVLHYLQKTNGSLEFLNLVYKNIAEIYRLQSRYDSAFYYLQQYAWSNDSLNDIKTQKLSAEATAKFDLEKKERKLQILQHQNLIHDQRQKIQWILLAGVGIALILSVILAFVFINRAQYRKKIITQLNDANTLLDQAMRSEQLQKTIIEEKSLKINDSIRYGARIQNALLPPVSLFQNYFEEYFIFYRPRDVVSGDFYWLTEVNDITILAMVDCTGHGVPGAFMSAIGLNLLNGIVIELQITDPDVILSELDRRIREALHQNANAEVFDSQDGMDVALCAIDSHNKTLQFAGAGRPIYYIANNKPTELIEIKGNRYPAGGTQHQNKFFSVHSLKYQTGDCIYLFSDGIADQFGGIYRRKFGISKLKEILFQNHSETMETQKSLFEAEFDEWIAGHPQQLDDLTLIGIRL